MSKYNPNDGLAGKLVPVDIDQTIADISKYTLDILILRLDFFSK